MKNILVVEDESIIALEIESFVNSLKYNVIKTVSNAKDCLHVTDEENIDLILMDVYIKGDMDGIECANRIKSIQKIPIIYISAFSDDKTLERAIVSKPSAYLVKPFNRDELRVAIKIALGNQLNEQRVGDIIFDNEFSFDTTTKELIVNSQVVPPYKTGIKTTSITYKFKKLCCLIL